jgi:DNA-binding NarL/FixJ family response regulator
MTATVLIADDSSVMRRAVKLLLNCQTDFLVVCEATNCAETIQRLTDLRPDVLLLDLRMPESHDQPMTFREHLDHTKIVAMTFGTDAAAKALAEHIGAAVLIDKADLTTELIPLIVELMRKRPSPVSGTCPTYFDSSN